MSLLNLSIYPQILPASTIIHDFQLLYNNIAKQTIFLSANELVCYCVEMTLASAQDMERCYFLRPDIYLAARILNQNTDSLNSPAGSIFELNIEEKNDKIDVQIVNTNDATKQQRRRIIDILLKYKVLFSSHTWSVGEIESTVYLGAKTEATSIQQKLVHVPKRIQLQCTQIVQRLLQLGLLVENSKSPWRSNILFLIKPPKSPAAPPEKDVAKFADSGHPENSGHQNGMKWKNRDIPTRAPNISETSFWSKKVSKSMQDLSTFYFMGKAYSLTRLAQGSNAVVKFSK